MCFGYNPPMKYGFKHGCVRFVLRDIWRLLTFDDFLYKYISFLESIKHPTTCRKYSMLFVLLPSLLERDRYKNIARM